MLKLIERIKNMFHEETTKQKISKYEISSAVIIVSLMILLILGFVAK